MEIKALSNGFVVFDNDIEVMQVKPELVTLIRIFSPTEHFGWRTQITGDHIGYISFAAESKEHAEDILRRINEVL